MDTLIGNSVFTGIFLYVIFSVAAKFVNPICQICLNLSLQPLSIPIVNQLLLWSQICALVLVIVVRVGKGLYENVFQKAANEETGSAVQWAFKSLISVAIVAVMPLLCNLIISFGTTAFGDLTGATKTVITDTGSIKLNFEFPEQTFWKDLQDQPVESISVYIGSGFIVLAEIIFIVGNTYQIIKRQMVMYVVSIAATWVSVKGASDSSDDVIDVLVSLLGLVVIQLIQWIFVVIAIVELSKFKGGATLIGADLTDQQTLYSIMFILGLLGCAMGVPQILERYAFSTGRSGAGNMVVGAAIRTAFASPRSIKNMTTKVLTRGSSSAKG